MILAQLISVVPALVVLFISLCTVNCMTRRGHHVARLSYVLMAAGAFGMIIEPFVRDAHPMWSRIAMVCGLAMHLWLLSKGRLKKNMFRLKGII